jgi:hypothetical protein
MKTVPARMGGYRFSRDGLLNGSQVYRLFAFGGFPDFEFHPVIALQAEMAVLFNAGDMQENVFVFLGGDKSELLLFVVPLNVTFHRKNSPLLLFLRIGSGCLFEREDLIAVRSDRIQDRYPGMHKYEVSPFFGKHQ